MKVIDEAIQNAVIDALDPERLELIILPTEKCNFRCTYCYEDFAIGRMSRSTVGAVRELVRKRLDSGLRHLSVSWFGGEPLLAWEIIQKLSSSFASDCKQAECSFSSGMTTNGYLLTLDRVEELASYNSANFQITLDGDEAEHDRTRRRADGGKSFARIWALLVAMHRSKTTFSVQLRIHVAREKVDSLRTLAHRISRELSPDHRFSIHFHQVSDLGKPLVGLTQLDSKEYKSLVEELSAVAGKKSESETQLAASGYVCYASKPNSLVIRADGRIAKCTVAFSDDRNDVGRLLADGTLTFKSDRLQQWFSGLETLVPATLSCPWSQMSHSASSVNEAQITPSSARPTISLSVLESA